MKKGSFKSKLYTYIPITQWLPNYNIAFFKWDLIAGFTLASFVLPESMAYATLAGIPSYYGIYSCLVACFCFAFFTTSRHIAVGPTAAISLMIGSTVAVLSGGDSQKWTAIVSLTTLVVACLCFIAFILKFSPLVNFISDNILMGFKAGAALIVISTQLPKLFGLQDRGSNFFERIAYLLTHLPETNWFAITFTGVSMALLIIGNKIFPRKPFSFVLVIASILVITFTQLSTYGIRIIGKIPFGLPPLTRPSLEFHDIEGVLELGFACFIMGYIETVSVARTFALKNNYKVHPSQEMLSMGIANLFSSFFSGYVVSGGLSQSTVNENSGAKTPLSLIICSTTLVFIILYLTDMLKNLPELTLAIILLYAVAGLIKIKELKHVYELSKVEFSIAMIAFGGVLVFGILKGVMLAVIISLLLLIRRFSKPNVALLGRIGNTTHYSDLERHPDNVAIVGIMIIRIESSILYFNAENIHQKITKNRSEHKGKLKMIILDLSASPYVDVSGSKMLLQLSLELNKKGIKLKIVEAISVVRDLLRKQGMEDVIGHISRSVSIDDVINEFEKSKNQSKK